MPINQYRVIRDLLRTVDRDNVIITHDSGSPREQLLPFWETTVPHSYMGWGKSTQLGYGLGLAMGAKLAAPEKLCINVMGDSSFGMSGMDIETASRNGIGILTVVFNNGVMACERHVLETSTEKYGALTVGGNYTKVAEGLNVPATRVEKPADIVPAIKTGDQDDGKRQAVPARDHRQGRIRFLALRIARLTKLGRQGRIEQSRQGRAKRRKHMLRVIVVLAAWLVAVSAQAQPFFEGKTITIITSTGSGGGYDVTARLVARHMPRYHPRQSDR